MGSGIMRLAAAVALMAAPSCFGPAARGAAPTPPRSITAAGLFALADAARDRGDYATAEAAYRSLSRDPDQALRNEARFRLGMMLADRLHRPAAAAVEFRRILDEQPHVARVRLELARMQALLGDVGSAERSLRAVQASRLPPDVERLVRFYAGALTARRPSGGSLEVALAPDSNINRATRSGTLGTVIGDLTLDRDARAHSGLGLWLRGQGYWRRPIAAHAAILAQLSGGGVFYRTGRFDDYAASLRVGPELTSGSDRITLGVGPGARWYGRRSYSRTIEGSAVWQHSVGKRGQLRLSGELGRVNNRRNPLEDATAYTLAVTLDRAFTADNGGGLQLFAARQFTRDSGYATTGGGASAYGFQELGRTTIVASLGASRLEADRRLLLFPRRRMEWRLSGSLAATLRAFSIGALAPLIRVRYERNASSVELYDYRRIAAEIGVTTAF